MPAVFKPAYNAHPSLPHRRLSQKALEIQKNIGITVTATAITKKNSIAFL